MKKIFTLLSVVCTTLFLSGLLTACGDNNTPSPNSSKDNLNFIAKVKNGIVIYHNGQEFFSDEKADIACAELYNNTLYCITKTTRTCTLHKIQGNKIEQEPLDYTSHFAIYKGKVYSLINKTLYINGTAEGTFETPLTIYAFDVDKQTGDVYVAGRVIANNTSTITVFKNFEAVYQYPSSSTIEGVNEELSILNFACNNSSWYLMLRYNRNNSTTQNDNLFAAESGTYVIKNGNNKTLISNEDIAITAATAQNNKIYCAGMLNQSPYLWIDGKAQLLNSTGSYSDIAIYESKVYATGITSDMRPILTIDGIKQTHPFLNAIKENVYNLLIAVPN